MVASDVMRDLVHLENSEVRQHNSELPMYENH